MCIGWLVDMDAGPVSDPNYFRNNFDLPRYPNGDFIVATLPNDKRLQDSTMRGNDPSNPSRVSRDSALCSRFHVRVNGFSIAQAPGALIVVAVPTVLLIDHTIDPLGLNG